MEVDYYSISILFSLRTRYSSYLTQTRLCVHATSSTQEIQCTFKVDIPDMGHLDDGHERDVRVQIILLTPTPKRWC